MGLTGVHLLVVVLMLLVLVATATAGVYFLVRKATAAGVRDAQGLSSVQDRKRQ